MSPASPESRAESTPAGPRAEAASAPARAVLPLALGIDPDTAFYFLSRITIENGPDHDMPRWQKRVFTGLAQNSGSPTADFCLPGDRTLSVATRIEF